MRAFTSHTRTPPPLVANASHLLSGEKVMLPWRSQKLVVRVAAIFCVARSQSKTGWPSKSLLEVVANQRPSGEAAAPPIGAEYASVPMGRRDSRSHRLTKLSQP